MEGQLIVIPTPIGNLEDISIRALNSLKEVDLILCEDTRISGRLLAHFNIKKDLLSYHRFNEKERIDRIIDEIYKGKKIALISDAGMPGISDPGEILIKELIKENIKIEVLPGPNAAITALVGSGINTTPFLFLGFLSSDNRHRRRLFQKAEKSNSTLVFYESPNRIRRTLEEVLEKLGNREICIAREISKIHEEYIRGRVEEILKKEFMEKGEMVLIIAPDDEEKTIDIDHILKEALKKESLSKAVKRIAKEYDLPRNEIYKKAIGIKENE